MKKQVQSEEAKELFDKLADIELLHQKQLVDLYTRLTGDAVTLEYFQRYDLDTEGELEILSLAMAIEVQALDLYLRAADGSKICKTRDTLLHIADEEREHIARLGQRIDQQQVLV